MTTLASLFHIELLQLKAPARRIMVTSLPVISVIASLVAGYGIAQLS